MTEIAKAAGTPPTSNARVPFRHAADPLRRVFFCRFDAYPSMIGKRFSSPLSCEAVKARTGG
jgi:hypothetical protein